MSQRKRKEQKQKFDTSSLFQLDDEDEYNSEGEDTELELKGIEQLTSKLAKEIGEDIFKSDEEESSDDDDDDEDEDEDFDINNQEDREFRETLLKEFQQLTGSESGERVSKSRVKELYLELLRNGGTILKDRSMADTFLGKLSGPEMSSLMELMQKDPQDALNYFDGDPEVLEAIKNTPATSALSSGSGEGKPSLWDEIEKDFDESSDSDQDIQEVKDNASESVRRALSVFEENILHFTQHPDELLSLSEKLPTEKDKHDFLNILFSEYTPDQMRRKLGINSGGDDNAEEAITSFKSSSKHRSKRAETPQDLQEVGMDPDLVALVFKEVLTHFRAYKKAPHKFDPLIQRLNNVEKQAFESLVKTFWDVSADNLKM